MNIRVISAVAFTLASLFATGCSLENVTKLAPSDVGPSTGSPSPNSATGTSNAGSTSPAASAFAGAWGSSTIAGLPLGNCSDVKWTITTQTDNSLSGNVTASCASGVTVSANLTGTLVNADKIDLVANGTLTAMGLPCQFTLNGTGTRATNDTMRVDYTGTYCLGTVNGSENLRKFPTI